MPAFSTSSALPTARSASTCAACSARSPATGRAASATPAGCWRPRLEPSSRFRRSRRESNVTLLSFYGKQRHVASHDSISGNPVPAPFRGGGRAGEPDVVGAERVGGVEAEGADQQAELEGEAVDEIDKAV